MKMKRRKQYTDQVLKAVANGDHMAVEQCIDQYGGLVWSMARKLTFRDEDAEDAVQEIFLAVWQNAGRYDPEKSSEATFVAMLARRRLVDRIRTAYRMPTTETIENHDLSTGFLFNGMESKIESGRVEKLMRFLRPEQKELIWLNFYEGRSHGEIATLKNLPIGTVKTHLRRGIESLRKMILNRRIQTEAHV